MKKCTSNERKPTYEVTGPDLFIFWDEEEIQRETEDGTETLYQYSYLQTTSNVTRNVLIEQLMAREYTTGAEFAAINNGGEDYTEYLTYRDKMKGLAGGYFA
jgi:hypothetical protein